MTKCRRRVAIAAMLALLLAGCTVERGESAFGPQRLPDMAQSVDMGPQLGEMGLGQGAGAGTLTGTWLAVHERSTCVIGQEQVSVADYIVEIKEEASVLTEQRRMCNITLSPVLGVAIRIPRATLDAIEYIDADRGLISSLRVGGAYTSQTEVGLWGVELDDPFTDPLPNEADDPRVVDADEDGNPAVTFDVGEDCQRYASQRQIVRYQGTLVAPNLIEGGSVSLAETVVYGATRGICELAPPLESNDAYNRFRMARIDGAGGSLDADADGDGEISCEEIRELAGQLLQGRDPERVNCR